MIFWRVKLNIIITSQTLIFATQNNGFKREMFHDFSVFGAENGPVLKSHFLYIASQISEKSDRFWSVLNPQNHTIYCY